MSMHAPPPPQGGIYAAAAACEDCSRTVREPGRTLYLAALLWPLTCGLKQVRLDRDLGEGLVS
jgi:hypothetical protein